jgi:hypothetical protein
MPDPLPPVHDYSRSLAVVMGTWEYDFLPPVPAARNSLRRMVSLLTGPLCGWPQDRLLILGNVRSVGELPDTLITALENITGVALFYYVGHGQIDIDEQLCLSLARSRTELNRRAVTSLQFATVRRALLDSKAATKIVILDCCFAGLANRPASTLTALTDDVLDKTSGTGAYTIGATSAYATAWYESGATAERPLTFFTKYLVDLIERGIPEQPSELCLHPVFIRLRENLVHDGHPAPTARSIDAARDFVIARNAAPAETHRDPLRELKHLKHLLDVAEARSVAAEAEAEASRLEAAEHSMKLQEIMREQAHREAVTRATAAETNLDDARRRVAAAERSHHESGSAATKRRSTSELATISSRGKHKRQSEVRVTRKKRSASLILWRTSPSSTMRSSAAAASLAGVVYIAVAPWLSPLMRPFLLGNSGLDAVLSALFTGLTFTFIVYLGLVANYVTGGIEIILREVGSRPRQACLRVEEAQQFGVLLTSGVFGAAIGGGYVWIRALGALHSIEKFVTESTLDRILVSAGAVILFTLLTTIWALINNKMGHLELTLADAQLSRKDPEFRKATLALSNISPVPLGAHSMAAGTVVGALYMILYFTRAFHQPHAQHPEGIGGQIITTCAIVAIFIVAAGAVASISNFINRFYSLKITLTETS